MEEYLRDALNGRPTNLPPFNCTFYMPDTVRSNEKVYSAMVNWEAFQYLADFIGSIGNCVVPVHVQGKGNRLAEAVSKAIWGTEVYASLLLSKIYNEIAQYWTYYRNVVPKQEDLDEFMRETVSGESLKFFHILALCNVLSRPIFVYAPPSLNVLHGIGHGGVSASFAPTRIGAALCNAPPIVLTFTSPILYSPMIPFAGHSVNWPVLPPAFHITFANGETIESYLNPNFPVVFPPLQRILSDPQKLELLSQSHLSWSKQNPNQYISTVRALKAKYDLVWQIELGAGEQRFICYNVGDDPQALAKKFVSVENLPRQYYDKILSFIMQQIENAKRDPSINHIFAPNRKKLPISNVFPYMGDMISYSTAQFPQILRKITEFNEFFKADPKLLQYVLTSGEMQQIQEIIRRLDNQSELLNEHFHTLGKLLEWPPNKIFPVLDLFRMVTDNLHSIKYFEENPELLHKLFHIAKNTTLPTNVFLILKSLVNLLRRDAERRILKYFYNEIISFCESASLTRNEPVFNSLSSLIFNLVLLTNELHQSKESWIKILIRILENTTDKDKEIIQRSLLALGSLLYKERSLYTHFENNPHFHTLMCQCSTSTDGKIVEYAKEIQNFVSFMTIK